MRHSLALSPATVHSQCTDYITHISLLKTELMQALYVNMRVSVICNPGNATLYGTLVTEARAEADHT